MRRPASAQVRAMPSDKKDENLHVLNGQMGCCRAQAQASMATQMDGSKPPSARRQQAARNRPLCRWPRSVPYAAAPAGRRTAPPWSGRAGWTARSGPWSSLALPGSETARSRFPPGGPGHGDPSDLNGCAFRFHRPSWPGPASGQAQVAWWRISQTVAAPSSTERASSQPPSMSWKGQKRPAGW